MSGRRISYTEDEARTRSPRRGLGPRVLRHLGLCSTGGSVARAQEIRRRSGRYPRITSMPKPLDSRISRKGKKPLSRDPCREVDLFQKSPQDSVFLRQGLKKPQCEICGQGEIWHGSPDVDDPRSHQRRPGRPSNREPAEWSAPIARRPSTPTAGGRIESSAPSRRCLRCDVEAFIPGHVSRASVIAREPVASGGTARRCLGAGMAGVPSPMHGRSSVRPTSSCWRRSRRRATWRSAASTASPTTRCASGCASTSGSSSGRREKSRLTRQA